MHPPETTAELLARVRRIEIRARRLVGAAFLGEYQSVFRGRGLEFAEVRPYVEGDDVRAIDWNVTARMGAPYVKTYVEERELTVMLLVDVSASSLFSSIGESKRELAAEVAAALAWAAVANNDRAGLLAFSDRIELFVPPAKGRRALLRMLRGLLALEPAGAGTDVGAALAWLVRVVPRRALVFVLSDFFDDAFEAELRAAAARHEIVALSLNDRRERALPDAGLIELQDAEAGRRLSVDSSSAAVRAAWAERGAAMRDRRRRRLAAAGVPEVALETGAPYLPPLLRYFRSRIR
jgi:uncharacterized protein (DUF58 family)